LPLGVAEQRALAQLEAVLMLRLRPQWRLDRDVDSMRPVKHAAQFRRGCGLQQFGRAEFESS
jgi:hypothetical protein